MSQATTVTDARPSELVAMVERTQDHIHITRNGEPAAVLVSYAELTALPGSSGSGSTARFPKAVNWPRSAAARSTASSSEIS